MKNKQRLTIIAVIIGLVSMGTGIGIYTAKYLDKNEQPRIEGLFWPAPKQLQAFAMRDDSGGEFGPAQLQGKWTFLFFGYTHCPDICPVTLAVLDKVYQDLKKTSQHNDIQMIFVSIDPERDTIQKLADYVHYFNPAFIGLGGTVTQLKSLTDQIGIMFYREENTDNGDYLMDHTASVFLIDPAGRLISAFSAPQDADVMISRLQQIRDFIGHQGPG